MVNPCLDIMGNQFNGIKTVLKELKRWEKMSNRREPITKSMIEFIINKGKTLYKDNHNNLYTSISDWLIIGLQTGFRRKEWAQDRTSLQTNLPPPLPPSHLLLQGVLAIGVAGGGLSIPEVVPSICVQ